MTNRRIAYELKKFRERLNDIDCADCYTAKQLKTILTRPDIITPNVHTFNEFMRQSIERIHAEGRVSYASMMTDTLKMFDKAEGEIPMLVMNHHVVSHFDSWMKKQGHTDGGRQIRLCHIKAQVNEAIKRGLLKCKEHPFAYTRIPTPEPREMDITPDQIRRIMQRDVSHSKRLTLAKDMFLLSFYLGGINFADLMQVDLSGTGISYKRQKYLLGQLIEYTLASNRKHGLL